MSCDQALDKLSEKLYSRLLVQEEHGFQKGDTMCPPWPQELKKSLAWIGLTYGVRIRLTYLGMVYVADPTAETIGLSG